MNICGVVVHAQPQVSDLVSQRLLEFPGVEVHAQADDGRLVVTVEEPDKAQSAETVMAFQNVEGVLSAALVYQYSDEYSDDYDT